jgi:DNA adenine methylase
MPILRYAGSKEKLIPILQKLIPKETKQICSPFVGGGSFEVYCAQELGLQVFASDAYRPLIDFWTTLKTRTRDLQTASHTLRRIMNRTNFREMQKLVCVENPQLTQFQTAAVYFALNRSSYSGLTCSSGYSEYSVRNTFTRSIISRLSSVDLSNVQFRHSDFEKAIGSMPDSVLLYLDPPYYTQGDAKLTLYGRSGHLNKHFDHHKLHKLLQTRSLWILCYDDSPYIRKLYSGYKMLSVPWKYQSARGHRKGDKNANELIVLSHALAKKLYNQHD